MWIHVLYMSIHVVYMWIGVLDYGYNSTPQNQTVNSFGDHLCTLVLPFGIVVHVT